MAIHQRDESDGPVAAEVVGHDAIDNVLAGRSGSGGPADPQALSAFVTALRSMSTTMPAVVRPELEAILRTGAVPGDGESLDPALPASSSSRRTRTILAALSTFVATVAGKAVIATAAVAVSVGGAHATGAVDVPGLPDRAPAVEESDAPAGGTDADPAVVRPDDVGQRDPAELTGPDPDTDHPDREGTAPTDPGVDGDDISDRATSGEPKENGRDFGKDVSEDAREGTRGENKGDGAGDVADERRRADTPAGKRDDSPKPDQRDAEAIEPGTPDSADGTTDGPPSGRP